MTAPNLAHIKAPMHTLGITPPDVNWYMDTGATSHMTSTQGNLTSYFNMSNKYVMIVGDGQSIPIHGYGHTNLSFPCPPLKLNNVLYALTLLKIWCQLENLQLTTLSLFNLIPLVFR